MKKTRQIFSPNRSFNNLLNLPPKADIKTKKILRKVASTIREAAELKRYCQTANSQRRRNGL